MNNKFEINPFDRAALTDSKLLAGRSDELRQIRLVLRNSSKNKNRIKSILITGERGIGKTSFLNLISVECSINNLLPIRLNLTEENSQNAHEFFWHLFYRTINTVFDLNILGGRKGEIDVSIQKILNTDGLDDVANWVFSTPIIRKSYLSKNNESIFDFELLIEDLKLIRSQVASCGDERFDEKSKIIYLVDEAQHLYKNQKIIESLRYIIENQDLGIGFVFAGDNSFKSVEWERVFGGSYRNFEIINLPYFDKVEAVIEYFKKSLTSIEWTDQEIEETLFYRFHLACRQIFQLTSGKPAWINTIASKMFERCMTGQTHELRFDKQAQSDVKKLLADSGELNKAIIEYIEKLPIKYEKWLAEIFACELNTFNQIYFYAKFKLTSENLLDESEFESFCKDLIEKKIITVIEEEVQESIGFNKYQNIDFLDKHFYAFKLKADTMKQWLQISSEGRFRFGLLKPTVRFIQYVNDELSTEKGNALIYSTPFKTEEHIFRFADSITQIDEGRFDVNEEPFEMVSFIFSALKKLKDSRNRNIMFAVLKDLTTGKMQTWNIYNYNDKRKVIEFRNSPYTINKIKAAVESYNTSQQNYEFDIFIDQILDPDIEKFQNAIIKSGDLKKIGIILDEKGSDLVRQYIKESDVESSHEISLFFYKLFEEGFDLDISDLNNSAYVLIEKDDLEKAIALLLEAKRKVSMDLIDPDESEEALLVLYNIAFIDIKRNQILRALEGFKELLQYSQAKDITGKASILKILIHNALNQIQIIEIKEGNKEYPNLNCKLLAEHNINVIEEYLSTQAATERASDSP